MRGSAIKRAACVLLGGLAVLAAAPAGAQATASIVSTPANGTHYVAGEHIVIPPQPRPSLRRRGRSVDYLPNGDRNRRQHAPSEHNRLVCS